jgi:pimeloyl-ACP methyl ester carboxylesterase
MATTRFAQNELVRLSYEVSGEASGAVIVLLHALLGDRPSLGSLRERLAESARIIMPDARGHGASSALTDRTVSMTDLANDVVAILETEGITGPVNLVGHGQGAITALELAHWRPDRIASLVLIEPDALTVLDGETDEHVVRVREDARKEQREASDASYKGLADKALDRYLDRRWGGGWRDRLTNIRLASVRRSVQALSPSLDALGRFRILPEHLAEVGYPVLIVTGQDTPEAERMVADRLESWIPGSEHLIVPSLPGSSPLSADDAATDAIVAWVEAKLGSPS